MSDNLIDRIEVLEKRMKELDENKHIYKYAVTDNTGKTYPLLKEGELMDNPDGVSLQSALGVQEFIYQVIEREYDNPYKRLIIKNYKGTTGLAVSGAEEATTIANALLKMDYMDLDKEKSEGLFSFSSETLTLQCGRTKTE